jgi:hypothetical protein
MILCISLFSSVVVSNFLTHIAASAPKNREKMVKNQLFSRYF